MKRLLFIFLVFTGCQKDTYFPTNNINIQGHRGARGLMPENTIPSFLKALDLQVTTLELDTYISKDEKVVVSHDPVFISEITLTPSGRPIEKSEEKNLVLYKMNYADIKKYDVGSKYYPAFPHQKKIKTYKPLLSDVIEASEKYAQKINRELPVYYNIEIKSSPDNDGKYYASLPKYVDQVMEVIIQKNISSRVSITSFDVRALQYMHKNYPGIKLSLTANSQDSLTLSDRLKKLGFKPDIFTIDLLGVSNALVKECAAKGIKFIPYIVNNKTEMRKLIALGVDGIITDYPNLFTQY